MSTLTMPNFFYSLESICPKTDLLNDKECEVFDNLHALEVSVKEETLLS